MLSVLAEDVPVRVGCAAPPPFKMALSATVGTALSQLLLSDQFVPLEPFQVVSAAQTVVGAAIARAAAAGHFFSLLERLLATPRATRVLSRSDTRSIPPHSSIFLRRPSAPRVAARVMQRASVTDSELSDQARGILIHQPRYNYRIRIYRRAVPRICKIRGEIDAGHEMKSGTPVVGPLLG
jgi:hypothetical protein